MHIVLYVFIYILYTKIWELSEIGTLILSKRHNIKNIIKKGILYDRL